jgi:hypothetical protein
MNAGDLRQSIATFTRIIELPDSAEGWNKRATLYFLSAIYASHLPIAMRS